MEDYSCTPDTIHRFKKVFIDPDVDMFFKLPEGAHYLCEDIIDNFLPQSILGIVDFNEFVILEVIREAAFSKIQTNIGVVLRPLKVYRGVDIVEWVVAILSPENNEYVMNSRDEDRGYLIADLLSLSNELTEYWISKK